MATTNSTTWLTRPRRARNEFYYFNDDGQWVATRYGDWKLQFYEQRKPDGFEIWNEPFVCQGQEASLCWARLL